MPIPELGRSIHSKVLKAAMLGKEVDNVVGVPIGYYERRNQYVRDKFTKQKFSKNVTLIDPKALFCDEAVCYAVKDSNVLYFDTNHVSPSGASLLVEEILMRDK